MRRLDEPDPRAVWMALGMGGGSMNQPRVPAHDVTQPCDVNECAEESELRYREIFDSSSDAILVAEVDEHERFMFVDVNATWERLTGRDRTTIVGRYLDETTDETARSVLELFRQVLAAEKPLNLEHKVVTAAGEWTLDTSVIPVSNATGRIYRIVSVSRDVTEARKAQEAQRQSDERLRTIFDMAEESLTLNELVLDDDGAVIDYRILDCNEAFLRDTGLSREKATGALATDLYGMSREYIQAFWQEHLHDEHAVRSEMYVAKDSWKLTSTSIPVNGRFVVSHWDATADGRLRQALLKSEAALRESEEKYRVIVDNIRESLFLVEAAEDGTFRTLAVNPAFERSTGSSQEELVGRNLEDAMTPELAKAVSVDFRRCVELGEVLQTYRTFDVVSGRRVYEGTLIPIRNAAGRVDRIVGITHDVTDREAAQSARLDSELRYRMLLEQASDAIFINDASRRYTDVNIAACRLLGYTREELLELSVPDVVPPDLNPGQEARFERMAAGETVITERSLRRRDGTVLTGELSTRRLPDGGYQAIVRDITERKRAEREQARLVAAVEQAEEAIVITDPAGTILYVNPAFERVSGYIREELLGANPRVTQSGKHDRRFYESMWATLSAGHTWHGTIVNRRKDGSLYEEDAVISPIYDSSGQLASYVGVKRDVTHERALEAQLRQAQKMEAIGQLAGGIAHDFNNLITAIRGYTELIRDGLPSAPAREDLDQIVLATDRAAELTKQLLAFSRRQVLQPAVVAPAEIVAGIAPLLRRLLGEHIELSTSFGPGVGRVRVDPSQLEQVIVNLAVNARDAMPEGGRLTIEAANVTVDAATTIAHEEMPAGRYVLLIFSDTGAGMDAATRARAFEPFFTTKETGKGSGMGLATVYGIVRQSGGYVYLYSEPDTGTVLKIYLPRESAESAPVTPRSELRESLGGAETVLLVEDEPSVRTFARRVLSNLGYRVLEAENGAAAVALASSYEGSIDLLVSDVVMPHVGGLALADQLAAVRPGLRVLLMSGFTDQALAIADGKRRTTFLSKPFSQEALGKAVRRALES